MKILPTGIKKGRTTPPPPNQKLASTSETKEILWLTEVPQLLHLLHLSTIFLFPSLILSNFKALIPKMICSPINIGLAKPAFRQLLSSKMKGNQTSQILLAKA